MNRKRRNFISMMCAGGGKKSPAARSDIIQYLKGGVDPSSTLELIDTIGVLDQPQNTDRAVIALDGVDDSITNGDQSATLGVAKACTVYLEFKMNSFGLNRDTIAINFNSATDRIILERNVNNGLLQVSTYDGTSYSIGVAFSDTTSFHKVYFGVNGSASTPFLWFDGVEYSTTGMYRGNDLTSPGLQVGGGNGDPTFFPDMIVAEVKWYDSVVTPLTASDADAIAYTPLEETEAATGYDVSGNGNDGTLVSGASTIATMRAARADGISSYNAQYGFREVV